jgi:hypothetical protein
MYRDDPIELLVEEVHHLLFNGYVSLHIAQEAVLSIDQMYGTQWSGYYSYLGV